MPVEIVPIAATHVESFHACLEAVASERQWLARTEAGPIEQLRDFVRRNLESDAPHFVAFDGERVVGWCDIVSPWADGLRHRGSVGMGVLADHRGAGLGRRLLETAMAKAQGAGVTRIELEVRADNARAIALYERLGFTTEARLRLAVRIDDRYHDALRMAHLLA